MSFIKRYKLIVFFIVSIFCFLSIEGALCRSVECLRRTYQENDKICWFTTHSYNAEIYKWTDSKIIRFYFLVKSNLDIRPITLVYRNEELVGMVNEKHLMPFVINFTDEIENCATVKKGNLNE